MKNLLLATLDLLPLFLVTVAFIIIFGFLTAAVYRAEVIVDANITAHSR